ncbi:beta-parvin-like isoform X1 [Nerophis ophidion]|uniref:beta-parvin-like isoform X1 n=1 Tax=Nerophis ophidion TaxID=159077 RepID=UPI002AE03ABB|nr:beta-parvin-like isoform X1 [Nerophis ophidion]
MRVAIGLSIHFNPLPPLLFLVPNYSSQSSNVFSLKMNPFPLVPLERDAFDTLLDHAPDKLNVVKTSLITFVNKHLNKLNLEVTELESQKITCGPQLAPGPHFGHPWYRRTVHLLLSRTQFADGVYLILLMGLLEDYFVPLYNFFLTPESFDQKVHNVAFAFELMQDGGLKKPKARPEDVVNLNLKSTLRVLYNLFTNYKNSD